MSVRVEDRFRLSPMQEGMLYEHLSVPDAGVNLQQLVVDLPEAVDLGRMETAWTWLTRRHGMLRARFVWEGVDFPLQEILADVAVPFAIEDARHLSPDAQRQRLQVFLDADRRRGFELDQAPLQRLTLFQWTLSSFSLVWTFHHALLDGRSYPILLKEVFEAYAELDAAGISPRPTPVLYRSHIDWLTNSEDAAAATAFWTERLSGFSAPTPLVVDRRVAPGDYRQGEGWEVLDRGLTRRVHDLADTHALTVNSLVMGAWAILLHRYSGEQDIVFGATRACRHSSVPNAHDAVGLFINTLPVRVSLRAGDRVLSVLNAVRQQWLDVRPYEHTPLARVKAASRVPAVQPLFETLVVFEKYRLDSAMRSIGGRWAARQVELRQHTNLPLLAPGERRRGAELQD